MQASTVCSSYSPTSHLPIITDLTPWPDILTETLGIASGSINVGARFRSAAGTAPCSSGSCGGRCNDGSVMTDSIVSLSRTALDETRGVFDTATGEVSAVIGTASYKTVCQVDCHPGNK